MNVDEILADPGLKAPEKCIDKVIKRRQFRLFGRLFRFDIIKEGFTPPSLFECDETLCNTDALMDRILHKELTQDEIKRMYQGSTETSHRELDKIITNDGSNI